MKIAFDLEGTASDPHTLWVQKYNELHKTNYTINDIDLWDFFEKPDGKFKTTREKFFNDFKNLWCNNWKQIPPSEKNIGEILESLLQKHTIDILTQAIAGQIIEGKTAIVLWLYENKIPYNNIVFLPLHGTSKINCNYDLFVDDDPRLAAKAEECKKRVLLYNAPWNQQVKNSEYVTRIRSFAEIPALV